MATTTHELVASGISEVANHPKNRGSIIFTFEALSSILGLFKYDTKITGARVDYERQMVYLYAEGPSMPPCVEGGEPAEVKMTQTLWSEKAKEGQIYSGIHTEWSL